MQKFQSLTPPRPAFESASIWYDSKYVMRVETVRQLIDVIFNRQQIETYTTLVDENGKNYVKYEVHYATVYSSSGTLDQYPNKGTNVDLRA